VRSRLSAWTADNRYPLLVFGWSRVAVYLLLVMTAWVTRRPRGSGITYQALFHPLQLWDAHWYWLIVRFGYDPTIAHGWTPAFYPLFPEVWRALTVVPGPPFLWASIFSTACFGVFLVRFHRLTERRYGEGMARRATLYAAIFPLSFAYSMPYSESLFVLLALLAFELSERRTTVACGVAVALACLTRPVGVGLVPAIAWRRWREGSRRIRDHAALLLAPAAVLAFTAYLAWRTGIVLANSTAEHEGWGRSITFPLVPIVKSVATDLIGHDRGRVVLDLAFTVFWTVLLVRAWRMRMRDEYFVYALIAVLLPLAGDSVLSMGRLGMIAFPLYWALADMTASEERHLLVTAAFGVLLAAVTFLVFVPMTYVP
jgi:Gpi18-like mannosyltransferase